MRLSIMGGQHNGAYLSERASVTVKPGELVRLGDSLYQRHPGYLILFHAPGALPAGSAYVITTTEVER